MGDLKFLPAEGVVVHGAPCAFSEEESIVVEWTLEKVRDSKELGPHIRLADLLVSRFLNATMWM